ncbi:MAG: polysaccharide biosynthesis/export family protein [Byssovorax sp.]
MQPPESKPGLSTARAVVLAASLFTSLGAAGCGAGAYVWVDQLGEASAAAAPESIYLIAAGDQLNIRVYDQDAISTRSRVGPDGTIALPLIGEIAAQGQRPAALARQIESRLKPFIVAPSVAITVEEAQSVKISVVGEVAHPGVFVINPGAGVVQALALAGGITEFADRDSIYVLRAHAAKGALRIRLTYADLTRGVGRAPAFPLQAGDTVVAE